VDETKFVVLLNHRGRRLLLYPNVRTDVEGRGGRAVRLHVRPVLLADNLRRVPAAELICRPVRDVGFVIVVRVPQERVGKGSTFAGGRIPRVSRREYPRAATGSILPRRTVFSDPRDVLRHVRRPFVQSRIARRSVYVHIDNADLMVAGVRQIIVQRTHLIRRTCGRLRTRLIVQVELGVASTLREDGVQVFAQHRVEDDCGFARRR